MDESLNAGGTDALAAAVRWVVGVLTGSLATSVCVIAVAALGGLLLTGRVPVRRGATVIIGCFIVLSASGVAGALVSARQPDLASIEAAPAPPAPMANAAGPDATPAPAPAPYDHNDLSGQNLWSLP